MVIGAEVSTFTDHMPAYGNWVWTSFFHHLGGLTLIQHCGTMANWHC